MELKAITSKDCYSSINVQNHQKNKNMNLFARRNTKTDIEQIRQIKNWLYETLSIEKEVHISLSQLSCTEPNCPPIETVIAVMINPAQQYKIHKPIAEIKYTDICNLTQL